MEERAEVSGGSQTGQMSEIQRIYGVIFSPVATFQDIARRPTWVFPLILVVLVSMVSGYLLQDIVVNMSIEQMRSNPNLTEEQIEQAIERTEGFIRISSFVAPALTVPLMFLVIAGLMFFTGNVLLGAEARFKQVFSVVTWSGIINIVSSIVNVPVMRSRGVMNSATNLTFLAPGADMKSTTHFVLSQIDLFYIWWMALIGVGVAAVYNFTAKKGITIAAVWWLIYIVIALALKALF